MAFILCLKRLTQQVQALQDFVTAHAVDIDSSPLPMSTAGLRILHSVVTAEYFRLCFVVNCLVSKVAEALLTSANHGGSIPAVCVATDWTGKILNSAYFLGAVGIVAYHREACSNSTFLCVSFE